MAVMRPAEGLGDKKATIQVAQSEENSDCDLLCWNQRDLLTILLAEYLALAALLPTHYLMAKVKHDSQHTGLIHIRHYKGSQPQGRSDFQVPSLFSTF